LHVSRQVALTSFLAHLLLTFAGFLATQAQVLRLLFFPRNTHFFSESAQAYVLHSKHVFGQCDATPLNPQRLFSLEGLRPTQLQPLLTKPPLSDCFRNLTPESLHIARLTGDAEGALLGDFEGALLGDFESASPGDAEGAFEGAFEGVLVGLLVPAILGLLLGLLLVEGAE